MNPAVSVIITTHNRREFVQEAIESVLKQDFSDYEIIVVDDGSTDGTKEALGASKDITYCYQENRGVSRARNQGLIIARGGLISFLDSDDLWTPKKLTVQTEVMEKEQEISVTYTDEIWIRKGTRVNPKNKHRKYSGLIFEKCLPLCIISPSSVMLRREIFDKVGTFDEDLPVCEDYDLWLRIAARFPILFINEQLIIKRGGHEGQLSHRFWGNDRFRVTALEKIINNGTLDGRQRELAVQELIRKSSILEQGFSKRGKREEAFYYQDLIRKYQSWLAGQ
jgi:glycosyltransferase involved in cell wall biosynthesis